MSLLVVYSGTRTGSDGGFSKNDVVVNANVNDDNDCVGVGDGYACVGRGSVSSYVVGRDSVGGRNDAKSGNHGCHNGWS